MTQWTTAVSRFLKDERGLETVEYAVMTALIVGAIVTALGLLVGAIEGRFGDAQGVIDGI
jgi:Flp pilus assembly pilin Flp